MKYTSFPYKMLASVICDACFRSFKNLASLRTHKTTFHKGNHYQKGGTMESSENTNGTPGRLALKIKLGNEEKADNHLETKGRASPVLWHKMKGQTQGQLAHLQEELQEPEPKRKRDDSADTDGSWEATGLGKPKRKVKQKKKMTRQKVPEDPDDLSWDDIESESEMNTDKDEIETVVSNRSNEKKTEETALVKSDKPPIYTVGPNSEDESHHTDGTQSNADTIIPYQPKSKVETDDESRQTDGTQSNDDTVAPYQPKGESDDESRQTDGTQSNDDTVAPYQPEGESDDEFTDATDATQSNDDTVAPYQPKGETDDEIVPTFVEKPEAQLKGSNDTLPDGSLVPFVKSTDSVKMITDDVPPRMLTRKYRCKFCTETRNTKLEIMNHEKKEHRFNCEICMTYYDTEEELMDHLEVDHPRCRVCGDVFANKKRYLHHYHTKHSDEEANETDPDTEMETESEDAITDEENPRSELIREDKQFHKHINCITIDRFLDIKKLIRNNQFESLVGNEDLMKGLHIIFKGIVKGFIPICSSQRFALTKEMKQIMYGFVKRPSKSKILRHKGAFKLLFDVIWTSVESVIKSFLNYPI